jgi:hypothetical protein
MTRGAGVVAGILAWLIAGLLGLAGLSAIWPAYASAVPLKAFSTAMLLARLGVAVAASIVGGLAAGGLGGAGAARGVGYVLTALSAVVHIGMVWADYPIWYHVIYLLSLFPVTALAGLAPASVSRRRAGRGARRGSSRTSAARLPRA